MALHPVSNSRVLTVASMLQLKFVLLGAILVSVPLGVEGLLPPARYISLDLARAAAAD